MNFKYANPEAQIMAKNNSFNKRNAYKALKMLSIFHQILTALWQLSGNG
jgi:hypothetical protein